MSMTRGAKMLMMRSEGNRTSREYGRTENHYPYMGEDIRYDMRGEGGSNGRYDYGDMNYPRNEYGNMNYGESRFRDRRGREHYDNGRFAPMSEMRYGEMRNTGGEVRNEMREGEEIRNDHGGQAHYPFGPVPPIYERRPGMNRIGFTARNEVGTGRSDASYNRMNEMEHKNYEPMKGGAYGDGMVLTEEMAEEWMHGLHNEDGTTGPHWSMDQTKQVMNQRNVRKDPVEFWAIMNALYSDYCGVLKKHGVNKVDFYADMACAWLDDKDAEDGKAARYFQYITK